MFTREGVWKRVKSSWEYGALDVVKQIVLLLLIVYLLGVLLNLPPDDPQSGQEFGW